MFLGRLEILHRNRQKLCNKASRNESYLYDRLLIFWNLMVYVLLLKDVGRIDHYLFRFRGVLF